MSAQTIAAPTDRDYFAAPGLSNSGMRDLLVSPLRYWHRNINPERVREEPTPEMKIGSALHCAVLEPDQFDSRYACELIPPADCLDTCDDLRRFIAEHGGKPSGTRKDGLIAQVQAISSEVPILAVLQAAHSEITNGKVVFKSEDWTRIEGMVKSLMLEPIVPELLSDGDAEVPTFEKDPDTGVLLKGKLDYIKGDTIVDLKTFGQKRGKSIDRSIADSILYEGYYRQGWLYRHIRKLATGRASRFILVFVESEAPYEVRIRELCPTCMGQVNLYWERGRIEAQTAMETYAEYVEHFGVTPWRYAQDVKQLEDAEIPGMAY